MRSNRFKRWNIDSQRSFLSLSGIESAVANVSPTPSMSYGLTIKAPSSSRDAPANLDRTRTPGLLADCAASLLPDGSLDVVCYACTSGSLVIGEERVFAELNRGAPNAMATSLITGVIRALEQVQARRIVVATPYLDEVNQREVDYLQQAGFEVISLCGLNLEKDSDMVRVAPDYITEFALAQDRADADAIFISCGALRTLDVIDEIESRAGKPAICSNQAMIWDCLRLAGIEDRFEGYGRLLAAS